MTATQLNATQLQALPRYLVESQSEGFSRYEEFETAELGDEALQALRETWTWNPPEPVERDGMVWVPPGPFIYGEGSAVRIKQRERGFWIDKYPVSGAEYLEFLHATAPFDTQTRRESEFAAHPDHPATRVSWYDAGRYAEWRGARLPSECEWEKAARGIDGRRFPWGDDFDPSRCNTGSEGSSSIHQYEEAGASPYGCVDMAGNVWDWTACMDFAPRLGSPNVGFRCVRLA